ncbi:glycosyltransferase [Aliicoccus persicus]|uniref:Glycosyltransferase involved in cell wall bisynthesis n=1 Tax=Aliicoccus persicus TaxID=930138 RepID=A0A662YZW2_9STAP|nr:glycosyltransferase [Aliicoccus persicus]SEV79632.1 Glycosyltransferase involved in cell wall bisynthesis [Aliicoccus persicus]
MTINLKSSKSSKNIGVIMNYLTKQSFTRVYNTFQIPTEGYIDYFRDNNIDTLLVELEIYEEDHEWYSKNLSDVIKAAELLELKTILINFNGEVVPKILQSYKCININPSYEESMAPNDYPILIDEYKFNPSGNKSTLDILYLGLPDNEYSNDQREFHKKRGLKTKKIDIFSLDKDKIVLLLNAIKRSKVVYLYDASNINKKFLYYLDVLVSLFNTCLVYNANEGIKLKYGDRYESEESTSYMIQAMIENDIFREKIILSKTRNVFLRNTFLRTPNYERFEKSFNYNDDNNVSVLVASKRREFLENFIRQTNDQTFVNLQIIFITHGFDLSDVEKEKLVNLSKYELTFIPCAEEMSFGNCLNEGLEHIKNDYVIKMDDDDYYYPNFIIDLLLALKYSKADVVGKYAFFFYLEKDNVVGQRRQKYQYCEITEVKGNTMICKTDVLKKFKFNDLPRHVDSDFFFRVREDGGKIFCIHPYDMCVFRAEDKLNHTYRVLDSRFLRDANIIYYGLPNKTISSDRIYSF